MDPSLQEEQVVVVVSEDVRHAVRVAHDARLGPQAGQRRGCGLRPQGRRQENQSEEETPEADELSHSLPPLGLT